MHPKSGQWLYVQVVARDEWCPSGVCLGTCTWNLYYVIDIFIKDIEIGINTPSASFADDTKQSDTSDTKGGRDSIQRDLEKIEKWAHVN